MSQGDAANRSRLAVGLRNEDDLSMIEERDERSTGAERSVCMGVTGQSASPTDHHDAP